MKPMRIFSTGDYKGTKNYLDTQKGYEIARTILYFGISMAIFLAGYLTTHTRMNLLTVVAVLGCLPACKSAVNMIMFLRYKSPDKGTAAQIESHCEGLLGLWDMVFTSYQKNFSIAHMVIKGNTICGFTEDGKLDEQAFYAHLDGILKMDGYKDISVKVYKNPDKYAERLDQLQKLDTNESRNPEIAATLKSVVL